MHSTPTMLPTSLQNMPKSKKPLRVGFDFDGVIMYNPARTIRPIVSFFKRKKLLIRRKELDFFIPRTRFQKSFFWILHQSSLFPSIGVKEIEELVKAGEIEAYIITARYSFLKGDFERWLKRIGADKIFKGYYSNELDEQPHLFKERKIRELKLDVFIEDNWDIVNYLQRKFWQKSTDQKVVICWIYNIFDRKIIFSRKYPQLQDAIKFLKQDVLHVDKPKVLAISDFFYPHWTGLSKSVFHLFSALSAQFDIEVLTVKHQAKLKKRESINGFWIQRSRPAVQFSRAFYSPAIIARAWKKAKKVDIVFINSPCTNVLPLAIIAKLQRKKLVIFHQGDLRLPEGIMNRIIEFVFTSMTLIAFSMADRLSTYTKDYAESSSVLRYYLYKTMPVILPIPGIPRKKKILSAKHAPKIGFAGRFVEEKGFDILFQAIPDIIEQFPNARFVFAGQTKMQYEQFYDKHLSEIKKVKSYIDFLGLLSEKELPDFYASLDLFVMPSRSECFGLVQAEAMLQGTPVITSDIPGARVLIKKTKFGYLFESENPAELADAIIKALKQKDELLKKEADAKSFLDYDTLVEKSAKLFHFS